MSLVSQISALATRVGQEIKAVYQAIANHVHDNRYYREDEIRDAAISMRSPLVNANGVPSNNLGSPTLQEMALFEAQFNNKTEFFNISLITFQTSSDEATWTEYAVSDDNKRKLVGGDESSGLTIPYGTPYFRIKIRCASYVSLNALYMYWSSNGHTAKVHVHARHDSGVAAIVANSQQQVSSWPGHLYLPFPAIWFHPAGTPGTHYNEVQFIFTPTWNAAYSSYNINLYSMQVWGGYPAGKRRLYSVDPNRNATFPATVAATRIISTVASGTAPISVNSATVVPNLNSDLLDGKHASEFALSGHEHAYQPVDADLTAIAALAGTSGLLKKTAANTWALDTSAYLTAITKAMVEAVLTGSITSHEHAYLTGITKAMVEAVLTGNISSHTHNYQPFDGDLNSIASLAGTSGMLKKLGANSWGLDTTAYEPKLSNGDGSYSLLIIKNGNRYVYPITDVANLWNLVGDGMVTQSKLGEDLTSRQAVAASEIDWSTGAVFTKVMTANTTFTFSAMQQNKVITLILSGNYTPTFPAYCKRISGTYDGSTTNYIQLHCTNNASGSEEVWYTISKQAA